MGVVSFDLLRRPGHSHQVGDPFTSYQSGVPPPATRPGRPRSARTATPWPAAAPMARSSCGMWPPTARSEALSPATPTLSIQWRSARTARPWAAAAPTAGCSCGTWLTPWTSCNNYAPRQDDPSHELYGHSTCHQARRIEECALEHQAALPACPRPKPSVGIPTPYGCSSLRLAGVCAGRDWRGRLGW